MSDKSTQDMYCEAETFPSKHTVNWLIFQV